MEKNLITPYFEEVETRKEYNGYFGSVPEVITAVILGSICGLQNISQIHQWAQSMLPEKMDGMTIAVDGKTIRSTGHMDCYENPLHIVRAQISELGITFAQKSVAGKSNEIPAVQELPEQLEIGVCMVVADALNCQKKTVQAVMSGHADYLLCAKDNQENLKKDIEDYVQDQELQKGMEKAVSIEKAGTEQMSGIIIFPAVSCLHLSCFIMHVLNGPWKPCTGCWMYISGKITVG